jgi:glycyl-tRNA synthetase beta chain
VEDGDATAQGQRVVDPAYFESPVESALAQALAAAHHDTAQALRRGDYADVLARLAQLQVPVDAFFDGVMVNADDARVRANRLALLGQLSMQFGAIADISRL